ncbi:hypothetical protein [Allorhodopirellula solitaria]|uniref:Uncharacterized protein n=1 Tax=Allorhodopirellula solitaria TaxID=2527987 RepID=A0A5C5X8M7_9BACT|nr:hypothetical protein [Allorhodopirellula solitaria]TWT59188.1 hypothetical protein CA85_38840 [Allorhodopirellula solitaria]
MPSHAIRPYQTVLQAIAAVWLIVALASLAVNWMMGTAAAAAADSGGVGSLPSGDLLVIAGVSGLIAIAATIPGMTIVLPEYGTSGGEVPSSSRISGESGLTAEELATDGAEPSDQAIAVARLWPAFLSGMLIRITGTVALFLASSYYMEASATQIGIWVLGWHLALLMTEVITLSRQVRVS